MGLASPSVQAQPQQSQLLPLGTPCPMPCRVTHHRGLQGGGGENTLTHCPGPEEPDDSESQGSPAGDELTLPLPGPTLLFCSFSIPGVGQMGLLCGCALPQLLKAWGDGCEGCRSGCIQLAA
jgi:hypothetical protein